MKIHRLLMLILFVGSFILSGSAQTSSEAGTFEGFEVTPEGAWCWFADPRAMHYETPDGRIDASYLGYIDVHGNIKAMQYDFRNRKQEEVLIRSYFQPDDHDNPSFLALPDGRIMVFYSRHTDEPCFYYRISNERGDITTLGEEKVISTQDNTTYPNPFILRDDPNHIYLLWRGINWHPTVARMTLPDADGNVKIDWGPYQIVQTSAARPYAKYTSDGKDRIYLAYTKGHPDNEAENWLYCNYIDINDLTLRDPDGNVLSKIADGPLRIPHDKEFNQVHPSMVVDAGGYRDWLSQIDLDPQGQPVIAMTRISNDKRSHNYYVARFNGKDWKISHVAHGGGHFHQSPDIEHCYSGGMAIGSLNPLTVYCSEPVWGENGRVYEIVEYVLDGNGEIKSRKAVTRNSKKNNIRPYVLPNSDASKLKLAWMNGDYYDWIVSEKRPDGYCTALMCDFAGFDSLEPNINQNKTQKNTVSQGYKFNPSSDFFFEEEIVPAQKASTKGYKRLADLGDVSYWLNEETLIPEIRYKKKIYPSTNRLATADSWREAPRATDGKWHPAVPLEKFDLGIDYRDRVLTTTINGLIDQRLRLAPSKSAENVEVFQVVDPDYKLSPFTGMTRKHWVDAAKYMLEGAFTYINDLDDPMYFPKQLDKTYPNNNNTSVAKLEGLARTFFIAAPLLRDEPDLELNGIKVADYYRHQIKNLAVPGSSSAVSPYGGSPSQTLLELGSICLSLKIAEDAIWNSFTEEEKNALVDLFKAYGEGATIDSNWRFFNVFILSFLKDQGYDVNTDYMAFNVDKLLERYRGEGWYNDNPAYDYYSMWAFQTYGPLWSVLFGREQLPEQAAKFEQYQKEMVENYPYMFARDGRTNMWGRSLPYRFASVAPFAWVEQTGTEDVNYGWLRRISSGSLLQFMQDPGFMEDGVPTMGFYGVFAPAVQIYSCRGSVYWIGKAFFNILLPEDSEYWSAIENEGPWETELKKGQVYNRFQPATNLLITDYPNSGSAEMRSWCKEKVSSDWQKFRSTENYNKLAYHTDFPWMADGPNGEISMNYGTMNKYGNWEVLRLYDFVSFDDGIYRRDAVLETEPDVKYQLADIPLPDGVLRIDRVNMPRKSDIRLGSYSLQDKGKGFTTKKQQVGKNTATIVSNGEYELATIPLEGWSATEIVEPWGLHPQSDQCAVIINTDTPDQGSKVYATLQLWNNTGKPFTKAQLDQVKSLNISEDGSVVTVKLANGQEKVVKF